VRHARQWLSGPAPQWLRRLWLALGQSSRLTGGFGLVRYHRVQPAVHSTVETIMHAETKHHGCRFAIHLTSTMTRRFAAALSGVLCEINDRRKLSPQREQNRETGYIYSTSPSVKTPVSFRR